MWRKIGKPCILIFFVFSSKLLVFSIVSCSSLFVQGFLLYRETMDHCDGCEISFYAENTKNYLKIKKIWKCKVYLFFFTHQTNRINRLIASPIILRNRDFKKFRFRSSARAPGRSLNHETLTGVSPRCATARRDCGRRGGTSWDGAGQ